MEEYNSKPTICRACLECSVDCIEMISLSMDRSHEKSPTYLECFKACTQLDIEDGQAMHICLPCSIELLAAYRFIIKARNSHDVLKCKKVYDFEELDTNAGKEHDFLIISTTNQTQIKQEVNEAQFQTNYSFTEESTESGTNNDEEDLQIKEEGNEAQSQANYNWTEESTESVGTNNEEDLQIKKEENKFQEENIIKNFQNDMKDGDIFFKEEIVANDQEINSNTFPQSLSKLSHFKKKIKHKLHNWATNQDAKELCKRNKIDSQHDMEENDGDDIFVKNEIDSDTQESDLHSNSESLPPLFTKLNHVEKHVVGNHKRTRCRQLWDTDNMKEAIRCVKEGEMGWYRAAKEFNVPKSTLRRHATKIKEEQGAKKGILGVKPVFSCAIEKQLVAHIKLLESRLFALSSIQVRQLAYQMAVKNGIKHRFDNRKKLAGKDWFRGFRARNPDISLALIDPTWSSKARGFNKVKVDKFFVTLQDIMKKNNISSLNVWNVDEMQFSTAQFPKKACSQKGAERGQHMTIVCCMSSSGLFIPPAIIFECDNLKAELLEGAPSGTLALAQESGRMTSDLFLCWIKHFKQWASPTPEKKLLLLLDGHMSHRQIDAISYAKENNIILMSFPPNCTHQMQPLDVSFFGSLKNFYNEETTKWRQNNPSHNIGLNEVAKLFGTAFEKSARSEVAIGGFLKTGISPFKPDIFPKESFAFVEKTNLNLNFENPQLATFEEVPQFINVMGSHPSTST